MLRSHFSSSQHARPHKSPRNVTASSRLCRCPARSCGSFWVTCPEQLKGFGQNPQHLKILEGSCETPCGAPAHAGIGSGAARPAASKRNPRARPPRAISLAAWQRRAEAQSASRRSRTRSPKAAPLLPSHRLCVTTAPTPRRVKVSVMSELVLRARCDHPGRWYPSPAAPEPPGRRLSGFSSAGRRGCWLPGRVLLPPSRYKRPVRVPARERSPRTQSSAAGPALPQHPNPTGVVSTT